MQQASSVLEYKVQKASATAAAASAAAAGAGSDSEDDADEKEAQAARDERKRLRKAEREARDGKQPTAAPGAAGAPLKKQKGVKRKDAAAAAAAASGGKAVVKDEEDEKATERSGSKRVKTGTAAILRALEEESSDSEPELDNEDDVDEAEVHAKAAKTAGKAALVTFDLWLLLLPWRALPACLPTSRGGASG